MKLVAADYPGRSSERRRRHSTGAATAMVTREVNHGGMMESNAASAAKRRSAPPTVPLSAPPNEPGVSFDGMFGAGGQVGAFDGTNIFGLLVSLRLPGTAPGETSVTPCCGTKSAAGGASGAGVDTSDLRASSLASAA